MDNYNHPDVDNYLLHQTHYYNSLNAFPGAAKMNKDAAMKGVNMKKNKESIEKPSLSNKFNEKFKGQSNSEK